jgi:hypothetical protein
MAEGDMSPIPESPREQVTFGVTRSARVLRKQKRASSSQPNRSSGPSDSSKG